MVNHLSPVAFFNSNFASGVEIVYTSGAEATTINAATYNQDMTLTLTTTATTQATEVRTGSGNDKVTIITNESTTGAIVVNTGEGNDTILIDVSADVATNVNNVITGGKGKDITTLKDLAAADAQFFVFAIGAGDSTLTNFDEIGASTAATLLGGAADSVLLDFAGAAVVAANVSSTAVAGNTAGELAFSITSGLFAFSGSKAASLSLAQKIELVDGLVSTNLNSVTFTHASDSYVYNENSGGDSLVKLVGVTTTALALNDGTQGAGVIQLFESA